MKLLKCLVLFSVISCLCGDLYAGPASSKLSALAESLIKGYESKTEGKATLAVFPFASEEKLQKQRVGFAVSELMSHRFVAHPNFTVVERGEINRLLSEQKLQSSGVTDSATAAKLGQMVGANALLMGNLNKVDGLYQVNARIVNAETGEIVASGYTELPVDAFADDAGVYTNLVPQEQTLGIYGVFNYRHNANNLQTFTDAQWGGQVVNNPRAFTSMMAGGGLLYRPHRRIQINAEVVTNIGDGEYVEQVYYYSSPTPGYFVDKRKTKMTSASLMTSYVAPLSAQFLVSGDVPPGLFAKAGIEFRPQSRIGFGVNLKYEFKTVEFRSEWSDNVMMRMNPLSFETVLSMYF